MTLATNLLWAAGGAITGTLVWSSIKCALNRGGNELNREANYWYGGIGVATGLILAYNQAPFLGTAALALGGNVLLDGGSKLTDGSKWLGVLAEPMKPGVPPKLKLIRNPTWDGKYDTPPPLVPVSTHK